MEKAVLYNLEQGETQEPSYYVCRQCKTEIALNGSNITVPSNHLDGVIVFANVFNVSCEEDPIPPDLCEELNLGPVCARSFFDACCANCTMLLGAKIIDAEEESPASIHGAYHLYRSNITLEMGNQCDTHSETPMESPAIEQTQEPSYFACIQCATDIALNEFNIVPAGLEEKDRMIIFTANIINVAVEGPVSHDLREEFQIGESYANRFFHAYCATCKKLLGAKMADLGDNFSQYMDEMYILYRSMLILKLGNRIYTYNGADTYNVQG